MKISKEDIEAIDKSNMWQLLVDFPNQLELYTKLLAQDKKPKFSKFIISGMGGSAIGGDLLRTYICDYLQIPVEIVVNRTYSLPACVDDSWCFIASSYSGNTEETLAAAEEAKQRNMFRVMISSGGEIARIAKEDKLCYVKLPDGFPPRTALGYSFSALLTSFLHLTDISKRKSDWIINSFVELKFAIKERTSQYSNFENYQNPAMSVAKLIHKTTPLIYASPLTEVAANRWKGQIQENAKMFAFGSVIPEMNHNEINTFGNITDPSQYSALFMTDKDDGMQIAKRSRICCDIIKEKGLITYQLASDFEKPLHRLIDLIVLGDWVSYYMAIFNNQDPTPIDLIIDMKERLKV